MVRARRAAALEDPRDGRRVSAGFRRSALILGAAATALLAVACASPGTPPGGPEDKTPPVITKVSPDSGATNVKTRAAIITFDEVVSERPRGAEDLSGAVVLSPSDGPARVQWQRDRIVVRPRREFRPNIAYSVTVMPGLVDLSGNAMRRGRVIVFSTGSNIPKGVVRGAVFDWTSNKPAGGALVEALTGADSTFRWIARTDSVGRFTLPLLPPGSYTLRALIDANKNGKIDARELWDSVSVNVADSLRRDLYAFAHDTLGARIIGVDVKDSVTLRLTFDRPLAPDATPKASQVEIQRADSSRIAVRTLERAAIIDSLARVREAAAKDSAMAAKDSAMRADTSKAGRAALARADSVKEMQRRDSIEKARQDARRAVRDTMPKVIPPVPTRAVLASELVAVLAEPLAPGSYRIFARDIVSVSKITRTSDRGFTVAKPEAKKPAAQGKPDQQKAVDAGKGGAKADTVKTAPVAPAKPAAAPPVTKPPVR